MGQRFRCKVKPPVYRRRLWLGVRAWRGKRWSVAHVAASSADAERGSVLEGDAMFDRDTGTSHSNRGERAVMSKGVNHRAGFVRVRSES
jgi:hypothetical protein